MIGYHAQTVPLVPACTNAVETLARTRSPTWKRVSIVSLQLIIHLEGSSADRMPRSRQPRAAMAHGAASVRNADFSQHLPGVCSTIPASQSFFPPLALVDYSPYFFAHSPLGPRRVVLGQQPRHRDRPARCIHCDHAEIS